MSQTIYSGKAMNDYEIDEGASGVVFDRAVADEFIKYKNDEITREEWDNAGAPILKVTASFYVPGKDDQVKSVMINRSIVEDFYGQGMECPYNFKDLNTDVMFDHMFKDNYFLENLVSKQ